MIIGLVGQNCAGKDTAAAYLVSKGFERYSLSDYLRMELEKQGKEPTRENLIELGNKLRHEKGPGFLGEKALEHMTPEGRNYVVVSIRNPAEAKALLKRKDFVLVAVDAPARVRFERMKARGREEDPQTFEEFLALENKENAGGEKLSVNETMRLADYTIDASGSIEEEEKEVEKLCLKLNI
ncbi:MAG: AAA family ATPase [Candidatus Norongarragalinales archaeon]